MHRQVLGEQVQPVGHARGHAKAPAQAAAQAVVVRAVAAFPVQGVVAAGNQAGIRVVVGEVLLNPIVDGVHPLTGVLLLPGDLLRQLDV